MKQIRECSDAILQRHFFEKFCSQSIKRLMQALAVSKQSAVFDDVARLKRKVSLENKSSCCVPAYLCDQCLNAVNKIDASPVEA